MKGYSCLLSVKQNALTFFTAKTGCLSCIHGPIQRGHEKSNHTTPHFQALYTSRAWGKNAGHALQGMPVAKNERAIRSTLGKTADRS